MAIVPSPSLHYLFPTRTTPLDTATRHDFAALNVTIPQTGSRTFTSCWIEVRAVRLSGTGNITSRMLGIKLGAAAFSDETITHTISQLGESEVHCFKRDVTAYFTANFGSGGTAVACQVAFQYAGAANDMANVTAKLVVNFDFDDAHASADRRVNCIPIPLESLTGSLATTLQSIGTNQIPALDSVLAEDGITYERIAFEFFGQNNSAASSQPTLAVALDAEAEFAFGATGAQSSSMLIHHNWIRDDMDTSAVHDLLARDLAQTNRWACLSAWLWVVYTYDYDTSTMLTYCQRPPVQFPNNLATSEAPSRARAVVDIQEPGTVTVVRAAVSIWRSGSISSNNDSSLAVGGQTARTYAMDPVGNLVSGGSFTQRFDAGAAEGSGHTFARGKNIIEMTAYCTLDNTAGIELNAVSGYVVVVYTAGKPTSGHHAVTQDLLILVDTAPTWQVKADYTPPASLADRALIGVTVDSEWFARNVSGFSVINGEIFSGELGGRLEALAIYRTASINENCYIRDIVQLQLTTVKRWPDDPAPGRVVDLSAAARQWKANYVANNGVQYAATVLSITSHGISTGLSGTVHGLPGDGSGVDVVVLDENNDVVAEAITSVGGGYTFTAWDDTVDYYAAPKAATSAGEFGYGVVA